MNSICNDNSTAPGFSIISPHGAGIVPIHAAYLAATLPSESGNPLIEALPAIKSDNGWLEQLLSLPTFNESDLETDAYLRSYCVAELKNAFIPSARHLAVARRFDQLIRWGYRKRNPLLSQRAGALQKSYERAQSSWSLKDASNRFKWLGGAAQIPFGPTPAQPTAVPTSNLVELIPTTTGA